MTTQNDPLAVAMVTINKALEGLTVLESIALLEIIGLKYKMHVTDAMKAAMQPAATQYPADTYTDVI